MVMSRLSRFLAHLVVTGCVSGECNAIGRVRPSVCPFPTVYMSAFARTLKYHLVSYRILKFVINSGTR